MCLVFPTVLATLIKDVISPHKPWLAYILSSRLQQCYYCNNNICRQKSASDSLVMGCISNWKASLPREIFFHSPFRQPYSQRKHSQPAVRWVGEAMSVMLSFCFLLLHLSWGHRKGRRSWGARGHFSISPSPSPSLLGLHMGCSWRHSLTRYLSRSCWGMNELGSTKGPAVPREGDILSGLLLGTLQSSLPLGQKWPWDHYSCSWWPSLQPHRFGTPTSLGSLAGVEITLCGLSSKQDPQA